MMILISPLLVSLQILAISFKMMTVAESVPVGGIKMPYRICMPTSVSALYPSNSKGGPFHINTLPVLLNLDPVLLCMAPSTPSFMWCV